MTGDRGLRQDFGQALHWLYLSRDTVYGAQYAAMLLDMGRGVTVNSEAAFGLLEPIVDQSATTRTLTSMMLAAGRGTDPDPARADALLAALGQSDDAEDLSTAAWLLATHPDPAARRPEQALALALRAVELDDDFENMDTLATAYAVNGEFDLAMQWQQRAIAASDDETDDRKQLLDRRLALLRAGEPWEGGPFGVYEYDTAVESTTRTRATFVGEVVQLFGRKGQNDPRGFDTEIGHSEWGLRILVQNVEEGSLPQFMQEYAVFYIHSPTMFFAPLPEDVGLLSAPVGPHRFVLTEIAGNGWAYDLSIEPL